jgi:hypothetical protein
MNNAIPLRAAETFHEEDQQSESTILQHLKKPDPQNMKVINFQNHYLNITQEQKQKMSGNYDGQTIAALPEMGVKILFATPELRQQYYDLRHKLFTEVDEAYRAKHPENCFDWEDYDGSENEDDRCGRILVATNEEGKVVAGARFLFCDWIKYTANEVPEKNFTIRTFFNAVGIKQDSKYVEVEDAVVAREYRKHILLKNMYSILIEEAKKLESEYILGIAIKSAARNDKILLTGLGCEMKIMLNYPWIRQKNHGYETRYPVVAFLNKKRG